MPDQRELVQASLGRLSDECRVRVSRIVLGASSADVAVGRLLGELPVLVDRYGSAAAAMAADWYELLRLDAGLTGGFTPVLAPLPDDGRVESLARWGVSPLFGGSGPDAAVALLSGGLTRIVANMHRDTVALSTEADDQAVGWARHASANACSFCRTLATRTDVYVSKQAASRVVSGKKRPVGEKYHDACKCLAVPSFVTRPYEPAPYVKDWADDYAQAHEPGESLKTTVAKMRERQKLPS